MQFTLECGMIAFVLNQILYKIGPNLLFHHQAPAACHQFGPNCIWHDWEKVDNVESSGHKPKQTEDWWLIAFKYMEGSITCYDSTLVYGVYAICNTNYC